MTIYSKLDEIGTLSKYISKLKDEMRDEKRNREEADTDYQNAVRKLEKGKVIVLGPSNGTFQTEQIPFLSCSVFIQYNLYCINYTE